MANDDDGGIVTPIGKASGRPRKRAATPATPAADRPENPPPRRRPGRPSLLNDDITQRVVSVVSTGLPIRDAAAFAGVSEQAIFGWRARGEKAEDLLRLELGIGPDEPIDADDFIQLIPERERPFVEFSWRLKTADSVGASDLAMRVHATRDPAVLLRLLKMRRPEQFRDRIEVEGKLTIDVSLARQAMNERLERLAAATATEVVETTAVERGAEEPRPAPARKPAKAEKAPAAKKAAAGRTGQRQGAGR